MPQVETYAINDADKEKGHHEPKEKDGDFDGIAQKRHSTDCIFFLLIIAMWVAMTVVGSVATKSGNPYRLIGSSDDSQRICGIDSSVKSEAKFYTVLKYGIGVCTDTCPKASASLNSTDMSDYYCLNALSFTSDTLKKLYIDTNCRTNGEFVVPPKSTCFCNIRMASKSIFHRCIFTDSSNRNEFDNQGTTNEYLTSFLEDMMVARSVIFGFGFAVAIFLGFVWTILMRSQILSHILVWGGILAVQGFFIIMTGLAWTTAKEWKNEDPSSHSNKEIIALKVASLLFLILGFLYFCLTIFICKRIELAIKIVGQAARAIEDMPLMVFTPIIQVIGLTMFMVPWVFWMLFLASSGTWSTQEKSTNTGLTDISISYRTYSVSKDVQERLWYMFFCYLWTSEFIAAIGSIVIAIACADWYFTPEEKKSKVNSGTVCKAYAVTLRYHLGTAAAGSLIIAVIEFIRAVVIYVEKHMKKSSIGSFLLQWVFCCINCCLWCIECCMRFISKNAYIQTAIHGKGFCSGAKDGFFLIARNILRIGALQVVSGILLFLGKVFVTSAASASSYYFLTSYYSDQLNGFIAPVILVMFIAWATASMFMSVFHMAADTLIVCFITDEEMHLGQPKYADNHIKNFIDEKGGLSEKEMEAIKSKEANFAKVN